MQHESCFHPFAGEAARIEPPGRFTWPFLYTPHPLAVRAAEAVRRYIAARDDWRKELAAGKMFGVLAVRDRTGATGFLAAFSGNLAGSNRHDYFVPPVYDMLRPDGFFRRGEAEIGRIGRRIAEAERAEAYLAAQALLGADEAAADRETEAMRLGMRLRKEERARRRSEGADAAALALESQRDSADFKRLRVRWQRRLEERRAAVRRFAEAIEALKAERHSRSAALQQRLFGQFRMRNARGEVRDLCDLFASTPQRTPPAGAGECAAPKLLQYAYAEGYEPLCMAEFWWGASPAGEVRRHGAYYPACRGKCGPILAHMLQGLDVDPDPLLEYRPPEPEVLWEDEWIAAVRKPADMLSVPGRSGVASVEEWARERYPDASGPIIVHRLDQATSGVLLLAKTKECHQALQEQFRRRTVRKRYAALLEGEVERDSGTVALPLAPDPADRPRQKVDPKGRTAVTEFRVVWRRDGMTRVEFRPLTGRTHQLRVHAAHAAGLNAPIAGDDLYGRPGGRLLLHAEAIEFTHPVTGRRVTVECRADF